MHFQDALRAPVRLSETDEAYPSRLLAKFGVEPQSDCRSHLSEPLIIDLVRGELL